MYFLQILSNYDGIPRICVEEFCRLCPTCSCKKPQITRAPLKPIISKRFHVRGQVCKFSYVLNSDIAIYSYIARIIIIIQFCHLLQVDLIDMRSCSDKNYNWIGHYKDHFSKYSIIWPQKKKCATETIESLERYVFAYLGVPKLLQSDNGKEFNNHVSNLHIRQLYYMLEFLMLSMMLCQSLSQILDKTGQSQAQSLKLCVAIVMYTIANYIYIYVECSCECYNSHSLNQ